MKVLIDLAGTWELRFGPESETSPATFDDAVQAEWKGIDAHVPGDLLLDLAREGVAPEPFLGNNLYEFRPYEFYQWWLRRSFTAPAGPPDGSQVVLRIDGINTFATVWLNAVEVGRTANMLVEHEFDVSSTVKWGAANEITIRIESPINKAREREYPVHLLGTESHDEMVALRMPAHSFGWDIMPRLLSAGIWRAISICTRPKDHFTDVYYATTKVGPAGAELAVRYRFIGTDPRLEGYSVRLRVACGASQIEETHVAGFVSGGFVVRIAEPELWWPRGYGEAKLYAAELALLKNGTVIDVRQERIGLRKTRIERRYEAGDRGEFRFSVNDVSIMAIGSNWVPLDAFHSRDASRLERVFTMVTELGCNMLRCWGGNVYEDHRFFDLCDENGILVWQDFSFACGSYPHDEPFLRQVAGEARKVIRKLRNHPSLLLWAGDNEIDQTFRHVGYEEPHARINRISREILPGEARAHDPYRPYLESSPCVPYHIDDDLAVPEQHNWGPRDYFKGEFYRNTSAHFISEIGYHGCPAVSSLKRYLSPAKLWPMPNDEWDTHNTEYIRWERRGYNRNVLMKNQVQALFGEVPTKLEDFVLASQLSQAEAKKFFIEMVRSRKWRRTGVLWWNLVDGWPQISDAVVDYYFVKKIAYSYIRRSQVPICLILREPENWAYECVADNNTRFDRLLDWKIENGDTAELISEGRVTARANANTFVATLPMIPGKQEFFILRWTVDGTNYGNHYMGGYIPMSLESYKRRLPAIEALPLPFQAGECVR